MFDCCCCRDINLHVTVILKESETKRVCVCVLLNAIFWLQPHNQSSNFLLFLDILAEKDNHLSNLVWSLFIPVKSPKCQSCCFIINSQTAVKSSEVSSHPGNPSCLMSEPCIFSNVHNAAVGSNFPSKKITSCSDNCVPKNNGLCCGEQFQLQLILMKKLFEITFYIDSMR